jgi:uncharacterized DUF497 family protein
MDIYWDEKKAARNLAKHKVSFKRASRVFDDPHQLTIRDPHEIEERWRTLGLVDGVLILMVVHTIEGSEHEEEKIRVISARKATRPERDAYNARRE